MSFIVCICVPYHCLSTRGTNIPYWVLFFEDAGLLVFEIWDFPRALVSILFALQEKDPIRDTKIKYKGHNFNGIVVILLGI